MFQIKRADSNSVSLRPWFRFLSFLKRRLGAVISCLCFPIQEGYIIKENKRSANRKAHPWKPLNTCSYMHAHQQSFGFVLNTQMQTAGGTLVCLCECEFLLSLDKEGVLWHYNSEAFKLVDVSYGFSWCSSNSLTFQLLTSGFILDLNVLGEKYHNEKLKKKISSAHVIVTMIFLPER